CAVEIAGGVHHQLSFGKRSVASSGEAVEHSFSAGGIQLEYSPTAVWCTRRVVCYTARSGRAVEVAGGVAHQASPVRPRAIATSGEAVKHRLMVGCVQLENS